MRITNNYIYSTAENNISNGYTNVADLQNEVTTGIRVSEASKDPVAMGEITLLQSQLDKISQDGKNATVAQNELQNEQTGLSSLSKVIQSALNTVQRMSNGTSSPQDIKADAEQLNQYLNQIIIIANSKNPDGKSMFAGSNVSLDAYTVAKDGQGNITGVTYQGNDQQQEISLGSGVSVNIFQSGNTIFGSGSNSIFSNLISFIERAKTGVPLTKNEADAEITSLNGFADKNTANLSATSNQYKLADFEVNIYANLKQNYTQMLGKLRDADYATTVTELTKQSTILKAVMTTSSQLEKLAFFNQDDM